MRRANARKIERWLDEAQDQLLAKNYVPVIALCQNVLKATPPRNKQRAEALAFMANAYAMLKRFEDAYNALNEVVTITPNEAYLWYNKSMVALYTSRTGQAVRDIERAAELEGAGDMAEEYAKKLAFTKDIAQKELQLRGPDFTLEQLIGQQELFHEAMTLFDTGDWEAAEQRFRQVIDMGDCVPQPQGNLGTCLLMQRRFDEAEVAYERALEIEPGYKLARNHLKHLKTIRKTGQLPQVVTNQPFQDAKVFTRFMRIREFFER